MAGGKRQASIFDFPESNTNVPEFPQAEIAAEPSEPESIACPVCSSSLATLLMQQRIQHVEECLSLQAIRSENDVVVVKEEVRVSVTKRSKKEEKPLRPKKLKLGPAQLEKIKYINKRTRERKEPKESKDKSDVKGTKGLEDFEEIEDSEVSSASKSVPLKTEGPEEPELLVSTKKNGIPTLKLLPFRLSPTHTHTVSVDAFCYKPSDFVSKYFLSHFHSDHYGGLTKRWCRERTINSKIIYCSEITARLLAIRYDVEPMFVFAMKTNQRYLIYSPTESLDGGRESEESGQGIYVTCIDANHCPGAVIFLYEAVSDTGKSTFYLHCGDFRVSKDMMLHPLLRRFLVGGDLQLARVYLDTTYMSPQYNFPKQEQVCDSIAEMVQQFVHNDAFTKLCFGSSLQARITDFASWGKSQPKKYLIVVGTYLIGKEKIAVSISKRMGNAPIYVSNISSRGDKGRIVKSYQDEYIDSVLTDDPVALENHNVMIHLVPMKIAGTVEELSKYFNCNQYYNNFQRCVGLRPTGWSFKGGSDPFTECLLTELGGREDLRYQKEVSPEDSQKGRNELKKEVEIKEEIKMEEGLETTNVVIKEEVDIKEELEMEENFEIKEENSDLSIENGVDAKVIEAAATLLKQSPQYSHHNILEENAPKSTNKLDRSIYRVFSLPYSEHSSFRELSYFVVFLNIQRVIPTVNTGNPWSVRKMDKIIGWWEALRQKLIDGSAAEPARELTLEDF